MPQAPRPLIRPNTYYHIYNRGNNRRTLFRQRADYQRFLRLLKKYMEPVGYVLSYALMPNHYHLTVRMKPADEIPAKLLKSPAALGRTFGHLQNAYANYFNYKYGTVSSLFEARFERIPVTTLTYLRNLIVYHHRNPTWHGIQEDYKTYLWTSYHEFASPTEDSCVALDLTVAKFGSLDAFFAAHDGFTPPLEEDLEFEE